MKFIKSILKVLKYAIIGLLIAFDIWFVVSYIDIIADNCEPNPSHVSWNMFTVLFSE